ncbi:MAG: transposase [Eubacteriales bacterium]|nr:transposase [Eubacteriales bacterium]
MILTKEEKIRYIKEYNEGKPIKTPDGFRSRSAFKNSLLNWVKRYNLEGEEGLDRKPGRTPTPEERAAVVRRVKGGERTVDVAKDTGFSSGAISNWIRASSLPAENQVNSSLTEEEETMPEAEKNSPEPSDKETIRRLRAENDRLRAEVAVLKKSIALKVTKARQQRKRK